MPNNTCKPLSLAQKTEACSVLMNRALILNERDLVLEAMNLFLQLLRNSARALQRFKLLLQAVKIGARIRAIVVAFQMIQHQDSSLWQGLFGFAFVVALIGCAGGRILVPVTLLLVSHAAHSF